jgi:hypothetical protein
VAALTFVGLVYQTVPMSTTQTVTQESTEALMSYSPYLVANIVTYPTTGTITSFFEVRFTTTICGSPTPPWCSVTPWYHGTLTYLPITQAAQSTYTTTGVSVIRYSQTVTGPNTESSTNLVPASQAIGLTDETFSVLAVVVIGLLSLLTILIAMKSKPARV